MEFLYLSFMEMLTPNNKLKSLRDIDLGIQYCIGFFMDIWE
jgi:hypothetical protein